MVTGLDDRRDVDTAFSLGANDYIIKPYELSNVLLRIRALL